MKRYSPNEIQALIGSEINNLAFPDKPRLLYDPIKYILSIGGKRFRPTLLLLAYNIFRDDIEKALPAAMGIEVFHNFTLLHDDIMDKAAMRRGNPTVHNKWNENVAILSGDVMSIIAGRYVSQVDNTVLPAALKLFNQTAIEVCEGQQYDMDFETQKLVQLKDYIRMIELKTSVLLAASLKMGALIAGADKEDQENLYKFGRNTGIGFQIQDDYLDSFGNEESFGKKIGGDILANKKTFLLVSALQAANETDQQEIMRILETKSNNDDDKIKRILYFYEKLGVKEKAEKTMNEYFQKGIRLLDQVKTEKNNLKILKEFSLKLIKRQS